MSRLGRKPIIIPSNVKFSLSDNLISFDGVLGKSQYQIPSGLDININKNEILVICKESRLLGTVVRMIENRIKGVSVGFTKILNLQGVGYRASVSGSVLELKVGRSHQVLYNIPNGVSISVKVNTEIIVFGIDKHLVGQVASEIKLFRKPNVYIGSGIKVVGEFSPRKEVKKK